ncbi:MAG: ATP-dependent sacrificial sulfur transferase LarE [Desulfobacterales bacterium]|nr:ATP-dependent sacrificial sulfur transferase LarE [Desulfobacterales bacterium]MDH4009298.1 ATP-dependent sacrificial sulfur transferase LarE [Desulfobacterales bacterium]
MMQETEKQNLAPEAWAAKLKAYFSGHEGAIIAYSGGVDSALLAYVAHLTLGDNMLAALADSPSLSRREYRHAVAFARAHDIPLEIIDTREMQNPFYAANQGDRCYHCKKALFERIEELRMQPGNPFSNSSWPVFYGVNLDDLGDYRPGMQAADEAAIQPPYLELKMDKTAIRTVCNFFGLEVADKPAMPCMASRIAYGQEVSVEKLKQVEAAEDFLSGLGFKVLRVRHHGDTARIEIAPEDFALAMQHRETISQKLHGFGFLYVALDLDGFKSGSLNAVLEKK